MAYQALYRSYRPMSFKEVVGQEHVIHTLKNAVKENRTSHAYVFSGLRGVGKTTIARILAKAVNCENPVDGEPCNCCPSCKAINDFTTTDIIELDAASNNGVDEIREILEKVNYQPSMLRKKVYIIDEVHMLTTSAFNALLKTLEEPPMFVMFILATTEPHKIPLTILSRCQRFDFKQLTLPELSNHLKDIASEENIKINDEAVQAISEAAEGGMRDAISILDQTSTYTDGEITLDDVNNITGNVTNERLINVIDALNNSDASLAIEKINEIINNGKETSRVISGLIEYCKDLLLYKQLENKPSNKSIYINNDFIRQAMDSDINKIFYYIDVLNDTLNKIKFSTTPKIYLEVGIMKIVNNATNQAEIMTKLQELEEKLNNVNVNYDGNTQVVQNNSEYQSTIRSLIAEVNQIKVSIENNPIQSQVRLIESKLNNQYQELLEKISTNNNAEQETNTLIPNTFDEESINELNRKVEELSDALVNANEQIKELRELVSIHNNENEGTLFSDFDEPIENKDNLEDIKKTINQLENRIYILESNNESVDLSSIYNEIENIKADLANVYDHIDNKIEVVEQVKVEEQPEEVIVEEPIVKQSEEPYEQGNLFDTIEETEPEPEVVEDTPSKNEEEIIEPESSQESIETIELEPEVVEDTPSENEEAIIEPEPSQELEEVKESIDVVEQQNEENVDAPTEVEEPVVVEEPVQIEEVPQEPDEIDITDQVYDIKILEMILNDAMTTACRTEKPFILDKWPTITDKIGGKLLETANILVSAKLQANGVTHLLLVFDTPQICNLLMEPEKHKEAMEVIKYAYNHDYDFLALPKDTWEEKRFEYRTNYSVGITTAKLRPINNPQLRVVIRKDDGLANDKHHQVEKINKEIDDFFDDEN